MALALGSTAAPGAGVAMANPRLSKLELKIMEVFWDRGTLSIREVQEAFPEKTRPAYTTVQTVVGRLEAKKALRRSRKISNTYLYEVMISRSSAQRRLVDDFIALFGGRMQPMMTHLVDAGKITMEDVRKVEEMVREKEQKKERK